MTRATTLAALLIFGWFAAPVLAHEWFPPGCCSGRDCWRSDPANVTATAGGWRIETTGEVVPYDDPRVKPTPPEGGNAFYVCHYGGNAVQLVRCLFVPDMGA